MAPAAALVTYFLCFQRTWIVLVFGSYAYIALISTLWKTVFYATPDFVTRKKDRGAAMRGFRDVTSLDRKRLGENRQDLPERNEVWRGGNASRRVEYKDFEF